MIQTEHVMRLKQVRIQIRKIGRAFFFSFSFSIHYFRKLGARDETPTKTIEQLAEECGEGCQVSA